ncbi:type I restriction enzyme, S subunit [Pseudomonas sp. NFIX51]|uniref:restriction endonuclease subunit S n=1 Tax=unclassified Pseudomonas TaxID=196821 RepID=UPI0008ACB873|nr:MULTISPECIES: restriction endonuclease subunit S [unclassified Pseudomonas]SEK63580.1 type I restriction enzyme, S subunit [Pseudomonas sp. NFACC41-3]SMH47440.1 type I restriction enzyme, S subunit [Pseudomonas sp. NFIX51]
MSSDRYFTLGDFVSLQRGTTYKGNLLGLPGPVLLGLASIQPNGGFRQGAFKTYGGESPEKITLGVGDLYVSLKDVTQSGDLLGSVARVPKNVEKGRLTQDTVKLVFDKKAISAEYIYWLLRTPIYREYCRARGTGTTTLGLAREDFLGFRVPVPTEAENSLVELLEIIEARVELLKETNASLETIAKVLFKSWFVDFDPVRSKSEGLEPEGMDGSILSLFPDGLEESAQGVAPSGWSTAKLGDVCDYLSRGISPKYTEDDGVLVINQKCIRDFSVDYTKARRHDPLKRKIDGRMLKVGDVLINSTGVGTLGRVAQVLALPELAIADSHVTVVRAGPLLNSTFLGQWIARKQPEIEAMGEGSTGQTELAKSKLSDLPILIPSAPILSAFDELVSPLKSSIALNESRVSSLTQLRDTLLPRLISGQLRLSEAIAATEKILSEAI